jgi:predicted O-methyltransferase YrrM
MEDWIARLFEDPDLLDMGHAQRAEDRNLGMGWLYYGLVRLIRPRLSVVIGSWRGFVPLLLGRAHADNLEGGEVWFIDPSLADGHWRDATKVRAWFEARGVSNVRHFLMTTQEFAQSEARRTMGEVGLLFVDGYHTAEQARFDHEAFADRMAPGSITCFHDSISTGTSGVYGPERAYTRTVRDYMLALAADPRWQVIDLPFEFGLSLVRRRDDLTLRRSPKVRRPAPPS